MVTKARGCKPCHGTDNGPIPRADARGARHSVRNGPRRPARADLPHPAGLSRVGSRAGGKSAPRSRRVSFGSPASRRSAISGLTRQEDDTSHPVFLVKTPGGQRPCMWRPRPLVSWACDRPFPARVHRAKLTKGLRRLRPSSGFSAQTRRFLCVFRAPGCLS